MYFESHAHYDDKRFDEDRNKLLEELPQCGIEYVVNVGTDTESSKASMELSHKYDYIYASVGVHPHEVKDLNENDMKILEQFTKNEKVVAIGEIGLDYYYDNSPRDKQIYWFQKQIELANKVNFPVIIHSRESDMETFNIIKASGLKNGVIHCYSGSKELAFEYVKLGFHIGVGGVVTFPKARKLVETVSQIPLDKILIETDCPYLSPHPIRGERNSSKNLEFVVKKISEIRQISAEEVCFFTKENGINLFIKK